MRYDQFNKVLREVGADNGYIAAEAAALEYLTSVINVVLLLLGLQLCALAGVFLEFIWVGHRLNALAHLAR